MSNLVVYTAIFGGVDRLKPLPAGFRHPFVVFTDDPTMSCPGYEVRHIERFPEESPVRFAKRFKVFPHHLLDSEYSLWVDGKIQIHCRDLSPLVSQYLSSHNLTVFRHEERDCLYAEAEICKSLKLRTGYEQMVADTQMVRYLADGYPRNNGLVEASVILRRHGAEDVIRFGEAWWREIEGGSHRDQLSFNYVASKLGFRYQCFPGTILDNPWFQRHPHNGE